MTALRVHLVRDPAAGQMLTARSVMRVQNRHLASVRLVEEPRAHWLVVAEDHIAGWSFAEIAERLLATGKPLPVELVLHVVRDVLAGLSSAHLMAGDDGNLAPVMHGNVTLGSIRVGLDGHAVLTGMGTAPPPEGPEVDVHSVGEIAWRLLATHRERPVKGNALRIARLLMGGERRVPLSEECPSLPGALAQDIERLASPWGPDRVMTALDGVRLLDAHLTSGIDHARVAAMLEEVQPEVVQSERALVEEVLAVGRSVVLDEVPELALPAAGALAASTEERASSSGTSLAIPGARYLVPARKPPVVTLAIVAGTAALVLGRACL